MSKAPDKQRASPGAPLAIQRPQRWDEPFCSKMTDDDVDEVLGHEPFSEIDQSRFSPKVPLRALLKNDCAVRTYKHGELIVRKGDYGTSAFFILNGSVRVVLSPPLSAQQLRQREPQRKGLLATLTQLLNNPRLPEVRDVFRYPSVSSAATVDTDEPERILLQDVPTVLERHKTNRLAVYEGKIECGNLFGEMGALGRGARVASVFAEGDPQLLEIRWQGLRDIMARTEAIREHVHATYRQYHLNTALRTFDLFTSKSLSNEAVQHIANSGTIHTYGQFDWHSSYRKLAQADASQRLKHEPVVFEGGHYPNEAVFVLAGFARLSKRRGSGEQTISYLGVGQSYGIDEIYHNWNSPEDQVPLQETMRAVGYVTTLSVPTRVLEEHVFPSLSRRQIRALFGTAKDRFGQRISSEMMEFQVEKRLINGTATMMIDLERCTRCDDCVRACADSHDNNPRFVRHGIQQGRFMFANACMHCVDPLCMIGCPTGAIHRAPDRGEVLINDLTCIGCQVCAQNCPYDNIRMVEIRNTIGLPVLDEATNKPILKATKCDLCADSASGPACVRACPHDALFRVDTSNPVELAKRLR